jgi:hypothetical protein
MVQPAGASWFLGVTAAPMPVKLAGVIHELRDVKAVAPVLVQFNTSGFLGVIYGIDDRSFDAVSGGFIYKSGGPLKGLWDALVDDWFAHSQRLTVGTELHILGYQFRIVGIVGPGKGARVFIPLLTAQKLKGAPKLGTTYPALRAATLDPVDALSYE